MSEYTPSELEVLCRYQEWAGGSASDQSRAAEFDRWLAAHDAQIVEAAARMAELFGAPSIAGHIRTLTTPEPHGSDNRS
jgi:hypothetical protein